MTRDHIIEEIRRTASRNGGRPLGRERFAAETGIKVSDWYPKYWMRWGDALKEAGLQPNRLAVAVPIEDLLSSLAALMRELGHFPLYAEIKLKARSEPQFPSHTTFERLGTKNQRAAALRAFLLQRGETDLAALCAVDAAADELCDPASLTTHVEHGYVYLMKSGRFYKIGRTKSLGRREYDLAIQLPEKLKLVHSIKTDDPAGIEEYWHKRFRDRHMNGEWYELSAQDVPAFRRRKFM